MAERSRQQSAVDSVPTDVQNYVGGEWVDATGDKSAPVVDPATGEELTTARFSSKGDVGDAVAAGSAAFEEWRQTPPVERAQHLLDLKRELEDRREAIARALSHEHGKTVEEARGEIRRGIENVEVAAGVPNMLREGSGVVEDVAADIDETAIRQPLGVFGAVVPFNFPVMIPLWFLPYAVATGNAFVLKPSERVPLSSQLILAAVDATGLPDGVVNLVNGRDGTVNALLEHPDVEGVSFVGSSAVAEHVYRTAADHGKRVQAQGGAKNYAVVTESAVLDDAVPNVVGSVYGNAGQRCLANDIVVGDVYEELRDRLVESAAALTVDPGTNDATDVGPLVTADARERVLGMIETAVDEGADVVLNGREFEHPEHPDGHFLGPTLLEGVTSEMEIAREEIFGPVLCLMRASDLSEAIDAVNGTDYGNASSIYTESSGEARRYRYEVDAGNVSVNVGVCAPMGFFDSVESTEGGGIGRQSQCTEAGECSCAEDTLPLREAGRFARSKAY